MLGRREDLVGVSVSVGVISRVIVDVCRRYTADWKYSSGCMNTFENCPLEFCSLVLLTVEANNKRCY